MQIYWTIFCFHFTIVKFLPGNLCYENMKSGIQMWKHVPHIVLPRSLQDACIRGQRAFHGRQAKFFIILHSNLHPSFLLEQVFSKETAVLETKDIELRVAGVILSPVFTKSGVLLQKLVEYLWLFLKCVKWTILRIKRFISTTLTKKSRKMVSLAEMQYFSHCFLYV